MMARCLVKYILLWNGHHPKKWFGFSGLSSLSEIQTELEPPVGRD